MKQVITVITLLLLSISCTTDPGSEAIPKMVPDHTPYIAGLIEASPDTTHHYPEIIVGYFTDIYTDENNPRFPGLLYKYPGIYSPTLIRQITQTSILFGLAWEPETKATVTVRGPLDTSQEQTVTFIHEGNGIYGDKKYELPRMANGRYELRVELPDGRTYGNQTLIPESVEFMIPDSISIPVKYQPYADGTPGEEYIDPYIKVFENPVNSFLRVIQFNSDKDRALLLLEPDEGFRFTDRSNYLRTGIGDNVNLVESKQDTFYRRWSQRLDKPLEEIWMNKHWWLRFSFFSEDIGRMYFPLLNFYSAKHQWLEEISDPMANAAAQNDSTYLFEVSSIRKFGPKGKVMPKDSSDAIGFFSGYYSRYKQTTLYPIRNFDLDTVLTDD